MPIVHSLFSILYSLFCTPYCLVASANDNHGTGNIITKTLRLALGRPALAGVGLVREQYCQILSGEPAVAAHQVGQFPGFQEGAFFYQAVTAQDDDVARQERPGRESWFTAVIRHLDL